MPDEIMLRMQKADTPDLARAEGIKIAREMLAMAQPMIQGVQVSAPFGRYASAIEILEGTLPETGKASPAATNERPHREETKVGNL
jgi:homocysteine S-methyltransferase